MPVFGIFAVFFLRRLRIASDRRKDFPHFFVRYGLFMGFSGSKVSNVSFYYWLLNDFQFVKLIWEILLGNSFFFWKCIEMFYLIRKVWSTVCI